MIRHKILAFDFLINPKEGGYENQVNDADNRNQRHERKKSVAHRTAEKADSDQRKNPQYCKNNTIPFQIPLITANCFFLPAIVNLFMADIISPLNLLKLSSG